MEKTIKPLKYEKLEGLSEKQLKEHHDVLYSGYVKKVNEIAAKLKEIDMTDANATFSMIRELKLEETFALNGVKLHEGYFENLCHHSTVKGIIEKWLKEDFGSVERWESQFRAMGLAARGWVVLAFDLEDGKLKNVLCDLHNQGGIWHSVPLLIMDVYEHAYFLDYATARKAYIEAFFKNLDMEYANEQIKHYKLEQFRK